MPPTEVNETLAALDIKLAAVIALLSRLVSLHDPSLGDPRHPSLDTLLSEAGLSQTQIAGALGKDRSSVSRQVTRDRKESHGGS